MAVRSNAVVESVPSVARKRPDCEFGNDLKTLFLRILKYPDKVVQGIDTAFYRLEPDREEQICETKLGNLKLELIAFREKAKTESNCRYVVQVLITSDEEFTKQQERALESYQLYLFDYNKDEVSRPDSFSVDADFPNQAFAEIDIDTRYKRPSDQVIKAIPADIAQGEGFLLPFVMHKGNPIKVKA